jgi:hypothetical protein
VLYLGLGQIQDAALYLHDRGIGGSQVFLQIVECLAAVNIVTTGKDIQGALTVFRPGVHCEMGLGDYHYSGNAMGRELVEEWLDDGGTGNFHRCQEMVFKGFELV